MMYRRAAECGAKAIVHDDVVFPDAESAAKFQRLIQIDFAEIEKRVVGRARVDAAMALPKNHPMRFALLYGGTGPGVTATTTRICVGGTTPALSEMTGLRKLGRLLHELFCGAKR